MLETSCAQAADKTVVDDYYAVYAWDVVDIFFATVVASLPALNGLVDQSLTNLKKWGSNPGILAFAKPHFWTGAYRSSRDGSIPLADKGTKDGFRVTSGPHRGRSSSSHYEEPMKNRPTDVELEFSVL